jgi:glycosyltransferase involved in cell wall biosynthesis
MQVMYLNHVSQISGAEQSLRALLWQFRRAHADIDPIIALPGGGPFADLLRDEEWTVTFAPLRRLQRPQGLIAGMSALLHIIQTAPYITKLVRQMNSQLVHSNSTTAHLVGGLAAERLGIPAIWHARDLVELSRIGPQLAHRATWIIAISGCVAEALQKDGISPEKIRIIHNGLDPDEWNPHPPGPKRSSLREGLGLPSDAFLFGCVGQLVPWKNHVAFIEAAAQLVQDEGCSNARFVVLGGDLWSEHPTYVQQLRNKVKEHGLQDRFNLVPHQSNNVDAISALDAIVLPSHEEPFGRVLIEGMALRKPVVAYGENGPIEIINHEHDGLLVSAEEPDGLAHAMRRVLQDAQLRGHLAHHARETVIHRFHIADSAQKILDLYHEVLS